MVHIGYTVHMHTCRYRRNFNTGGPIDSIIIRLVGVVLYLVGLALASFCQVKECTILVNNQAKSSCVSVVRQTNGVASMEVVVQFPA